MASKFYKYRGHEIIHQGMDWIVKKRGYYTLSVQRSEEDAKKAADESRALELEEAKARKKKV